MPSKKHKHSSTAHNHDFHFLRRIGHHGNRKTSPLHQQQQASSTIRSHQKKKKHAAATLLLVVKENSLSLYFLSKRQSLSLSFSMTGKIMEQSHSFSLPSLPFLSPSVLAAVVAVVASLSIPLLSKCAFPPTLPLPPLSTWRSTQSRCVNHVARLPP